MGPILPRKESARLFLYTSTAALSMVLGLLWLLTSHSTSVAAMIQGALKMDQEAFVDRWLDVSVGNLSDGYTLDHLCNRRGVTWHKNLILNIYDANGGIGNLRGNILDFVYFAIATGSSILLPGFNKRSDTDPSTLYDGRLPFDSFFDEDHFIKSIHQACPQLHIYSPEQQDSMTTLKDGYPWPSLRTDLGSDPSQVVDDFRKWLIDNQNVTLPPEQPTVVQVVRTLWDGPDTRTFSGKMRRDFGSLLKLHPTSRELAAIATYNLARKHGFNLDPNRLHYPNAYLGAHLRTESDAAKAGWLLGPHANLTAQTATYLSQAEVRKLSVIYVASGSKDDIGYFTEQASANDITVVHKFGLLEGPALAELQGLSWDQQALVDYEILLRCSHFGGFVRSSFSYNIAITRQAVLELEGRVAEKRWGEIDPARLEFDDEKAFEDTASIVWGRDEWHERKIPRGSWP